MHDPDAGFRPRRPILLLACLIGLAPIVTGLLVMQWQVDKNLEHTAQRAAAEGIRQADEIIHQAANSAARLMPLAGQACDDTLAPLRQEVVRESYIRSAILLKNNIAYCSSLGGDLGVPMDPAQFLNRRLWLRAGNEITPESGVLYYRLYEHPHGVLTLIDGKTLHDALRMIDREARVIMEIGPAFLWSNGSVQNGEIPDHPEQHVRILSERYGYAVHSGFPDGTTWEATKKQAFLILSNLLLVGIMTGGVAFWLFSRPPGRRG